MKKLIIGATLFISGIIGIAAIIISCVSVVAADRSVGILFGDKGIGVFNLTTPTAIFILLILFGIVFAIGGLRESD